MQRSPRQGETAAFSFMALPNEVQMQICRDEPGLYALCKSLWKHRISDAHYTRRELAGKMRLLANIDFHSDPGDIRDQLYQLKQIMHEDSHLDERIRKLVGDIMVFAARCSISSIIHAIRNMELLTPPAFGLQRHHYARAFDQVTSLSVLRELCYEPFLMSDTHPSDTLSYACAAGSVDVVRALGRPPFSLGHFANAHETLAMASRYGHIEVMDALAEPPYNLGRHAVLDNFAVFIWPAVEGHEESLIRLSEDPYRIDKYDIYEKDSSLYCMYMGAKHANVLRVLHDVYGLGRADAMRAREYDDDDGDESSENDDGGDNDDNSHYFDKSHVMMQAYSVGDNGAAVQVLKSLYGL